MARFTDAQLLTRDESRVIALRGAEVTILAGAADTGGALALLDYRMPPHFAGPSAHVHPDFDEIFTVLEGELTLRLGDEQSVAGVGETGTVPGAIPHTFGNLADAPARVMIVLSPGGFEPYFTELAALVASDPPDTEAMAALAERYGVQSVGPPLT